MIYLDNAASTPVSANTLEVMMPYMESEYGNPSSIHRSGRNARRAIDQARTHIAALVGASPSQIILTSGGTESNNMAILGTVRRRPNSHIVTSAIEHDAVLEVCARLESLGHKVTYVMPDSVGIIDPEKIASAITPETSLVSVMAANNEVGTIQNIAAIGKMCAGRSVPFHTDAVQAAGKVPIDVTNTPLDLVSFSSHKINGPKGVGALYAKDIASLDPLVFGGGQEGGMRSGTENVAAIVGFGAACKTAKERMDSESSRIFGLRKRLVDGVMNRISHSVLNGDESRRLAGNAHFTFLGISGEDLIIKLDECGVAASTGSACSVHTQKESHVLRAMGLDRQRIDGSLRITIGTLNTQDEIDSTLDILESCVAELRRVSPFKSKYGF